MKIQRTRGIRKIVRKVVFKKEGQKFVTAGNRACKALMPVKPGPSDRAILAWAQYDLTRELISGFWDVRRAA